MRQVLSQKCASMDEGMMPHVTPLIIQTYVKQGEFFIPLVEVGRLVLDDPNYVDGSIRVFAGRKPLITDAEWTDIVDWWGEIGNVIHDLAGGKTAVDSSFPDCPIDMRFRVAAGCLTWEVDGAKARKATFNLDQALQALVDGYLSTFERLRVVNPDATRDYDGLMDYFRNAMPSCRDHRFSKS